MIALLKIYRDKFLDRTKKWSLPGFDGQSIYDVFSFLFKEFQRDAINVRAGSVAYSFMLSLFPAMMIVFSIIPYIPIKAYRVTLMNSLQQFLPHNAYQAIYTTVYDIINNQRTSVLSIGIILALYYSTTGVIGLINSFDKVYPSFRKRNFWIKTLVSFKITIFLFVLLTLSIVLIVAGEYIIQLLMSGLGATGGIAYFFLAAVKWLVIIMLFYFSISMIYYYGPALLRRFHFFSAGSTIATFLSILTSLGFSFFINNFGNYNKLYGSIGTLIVIMLWLYYNSLILLIGFELNASIEINKHLKNETQTKIDTE